MNNRSGGRIHWTEEMITKVTNEFPYKYNRDLASELNVGMRSLIRKARELGIEKEPGFLDKRRNEITAMAVKAHPPHPMKGVKGWFVPNSEQHRFKPGQISKMSFDSDLVEKVRQKRNETIRMEKLRLKYDLPQKTKLKLVNIY